jgi:ferrous iron transport protein B
MNNRMNDTLNVALVGNPNCGKSTLFNVLTGLNQKTGNFPGVTVEKRSGTFRIGGIQGKVSRNINLIDLPGTYSLFPKSPDEYETYRALSNESDKPDLVLLVADASGLSRSLILCTQVIDMGFPVVLCVNMIDLLEESGQTLNLERLKEELGVPVCTLNARKGKGLQAIKGILLDEHAEKPSAWAAPDWLVEKFNSTPPFTECLNNANALDKSNTTDWVRFQSDDTTKRLNRIDALLQLARSKSEPLKAMVLTQKIDALLTHPLWGFIIFLGVLLLMFQAIFSWSELPMDLIDQGFASASAWLGAQLPSGSFTSLLTQGVLPGLGGIIMFVPQIALLFGFIAILEDSGYMARVSFINDRVLRRFGINGKSIIPLISSVACAVPAILSARTIRNTRERLITIFITPLMSCSARIPVYTLLIAVAIPDTESGIFNTRGLVLMGLYLLGLLTALFSALLMKYWVKTRERSIFIMEMPVYRMPQGRVVLRSMFDKVKVFVLEAGKIIVAISVVLWALSSYGPSGEFERIEVKYQQKIATGDINIEQADGLEAAEKLRASYAGMIGRAIEPVIAPLGFDWKIGIALVTSFAAREVFVGTMATIYGVGSDDEQSSTLKERMQNDKIHASENKLFSIGTSLALMVFYAFALQCMSTIAVVKRETGSWKWPTYQFIWFGFLAWMGAFLVRLFFN